MVRALAGGLLVAVIAIAIGLHFYRQDQAETMRQQAEISELDAQLAKAKAENEQIKGALAKVQDEQNRLAADNDALRKVIEQARLAGKPPGKLSLPYPPK